MITKKFWEDTVLYLWAEPIDYMLGIMGSFITIPMDILLLPFEIIGFIIYKIMERS